MLFNDHGSSHPPIVLAISQPSHALISGRILAAWAEPLPHEVVLAAEQHDIAWLDWETSPTFDPSTGRPHDFRSIGAAQHAPMWDRGVARALDAWGRRAALLISRHGSTIYRRFSDRHRRVSADASAEDERAARDYLGRHDTLQGDWARSLGLHADSVARDAELIAFADNLSLILCGALPSPSDIEVGGRAIGLRAVPGTAGTYSLDPWPLASDDVVFEIEARPLLTSGRLADVDAMRAWLSDPTRVVMRSRLLRSS